MSYPPPYYTDDDPRFARRIMKQYGFALLVSEGLDATHLPLLFEPGAPHGTLYGHVSRVNPVCARLDGVKAMAVFSGPHAYISASLYDDPAANVPTWNYVSVQAKGRLFALPDEAVIAHLEDLSRAYEPNDEWTVSSAPDYVARIKGGVTALRLEIDSVQTFRKLSGNKPSAIRKRIIDAARARGEHAFADEMALVDESTPTSDTERPA